MKDNIAIKVDHIDKTFKLPHEKNTSIKSSVVNFYKHKKGYEKQQALKDVTFEINKGEFFGIVGKNGSGKSTLLKILAGIYRPDKGNLLVNGKLVPFIELGVGFSPELSGRDNVFLNGSLLGFSRNEMKAMYNDIVAFAELERFMDQKLKNYSSGMQVRLAFSIAIRTQSDILLLDEVLAVGDEAFQRKSEDFFNRIKKDKNKTVVLVSHSMESIKKYCTQAILIDNGKIIKRGNPEDVANAYSEQNFDAKDINVNKNKIKPKIRIVPLTKSIVTSKDVFSFKVDFKHPKTKLKVYLAYNIIDLKRGGIPYDSGLFVVRPDDDNVYNLPLTLFNNGDYRVNASIRVGTKDNVIAFTDENSGHVFLIRNKYVKKGLNNDYGLLQRLQ
jgi:ABC-2 type transport system ATP-binding protein